MNHESEDETRLRRCREAVTSCQEEENQARQALARAVESTKRAREKFEELFIASEKRAVARKMADYRHYTG